MTIHTFGAYFGLTVSRVLHRPHKDKRKEQQDVGHQPDLFAVVGMKLEPYNTRIIGVVGGRTATNARTRSHATACLRMQTSKDGDSPPL